MWNIKYSKKIKVKNKTQKIGDFILSLQSSACFSGDDSTFILKKSHYFILIMRHEYSKMKDKIVAFILIDRIYVFFKRLFNIYFKKNSLSDF